MEVAQQVQGDRMRRRELIIATTTQNRVDVTKECTCRRRKFASVFVNTPCIIFIIAALFSSSCLKQCEAVPCPNSCSGHGICQNAKRVCECYDGFEGNDCSRLSCPKGKAWTDFAAGVDDAHNDALCSNMGVCDYTTGKP